MRRLLLLAGLLLAGCRPAPGPAPEPAPQQPGPPLTEPAPPPPARVWTQGTATVPVMMYHDVVTSQEVWFDQSVDDFRGQMRTLKEAGANPITIDQLVDHLRDGAPLPDQPIVLTFDQGTLGLYENVWPILKEYGWHATFFVHTGYVGRPSPTKEHVTWDQLRELQATGLIAVEPMTVSFPEFLGQLDDAALHREIADSIEAVSAEMGQRPKYFAYPYGNGDERVARALDEAGIVAAFNEVRAPVATPSDRLFLPRYAPKRLGEAVASWSREPSPAMIGPLDIRPATPADGLLTGWPQPGSETEVILDGGRLSCFHTLLAGGVFQPLADAQELRAEGRPMIVGNQQQLVVVPYRRWMSAKGHVYSACDSLNLLVSPANFAVLGDRLVPDGEAVHGPAAVVGDGLAWLPDGNKMSGARRAAVELVGDGH